MNSRFPYRSTKLIWLGKSSDVPLILEALSSLRHLNIRFFFSLIRSFFFLFLLLLLFVSSLPFPFPHPFFPSSFFVKPLLIVDYFEAYTLIGEHIYSLVQTVWGHTCGPNPEFVLDFSFIMGALLQITSLKFVWMDTANFHFLVPVSATVSSSKIGKTYAVNRIFTYQGYHSERLTCTYF